MNADEEADAVLSQVVMIGGSAAPPPPQELALADAVLGHLSERPARTPDAPNTDTTEALRLSTAIAAALNELDPERDPVAVRILTDALLEGGT